jgi:hypothetical protein
MSLKGDLQYGLLLVAYQTARLISFFFAAVTIVVFVDTLLKAAGLNINYVAPLVTEKISAILRYFIATKPHLITFGALSIAVVFFSVRGYFPKTYGNIEIFVGLMTIESVIPKIPDTRVPSLLPLVGGIYIVIRGLDNLSKGLDPKGRLGTLFRYLFNSRKP